MFKSIRVGRQSIGKSLLLIMLGTPVYDCHCVDGVSVFTFGYRFGGVVYIDSVKRCGE